MRRVWRQAEARRYCTLVVRRPSAGRLGRGRGQAFEHRGRLAGGGTALHETLGELAQLDDADEPRPPGRVQPLPGPPGIRLEIATTCLLGRSRRQAEVTGERDVEAGDLGQRVRPAAVVEVDHGPPDGGAE